MLGMIADLQGDTAKARTNYEEALRINPGLAAAQNNLAWSYAQDGGDLDKALRLALAAHSALPDSPEIADTLGWVYYKKGMMGQAIPLLQVGAQGMPRKALVHYHLGAAYYRTGNLVQARQELRTAIAIGGNFPGADDARHLLKASGDQSGG